MKYSLIYNQKLIVVEDNKIATSADLDVCHEDVLNFLRGELDVEDVGLILDFIICDKDCGMIEHLENCSPRMAGCGLDSAAISWELQRLRGRAAAYLGFDAVEMNDEHGVSYLIVNSEIISTGEIK